jgi:transposase InsO family protein
MSRVAYVTVYADQRGPTCASFLRDAAAWFARQGVRIERVMTDNAKNYTLSHDFQAALSDIRAQHKRTRPRRPQTNPESERFNRTLLDEWAYRRPYETNNERLTALPEFVDHYNNHRPYTSLNGLTPMAVLVNNVSGNHT